MSALVVSVAGLWVAVLVLAVMNVVLYRQLGIVLMGTARGLEQSGLPIGKRLPQAELSTLDGGTWSPGRWRGRPFLMFFAGTYCSDCKDMLPFVREAEGAGLSVVSMLFHDGGESAAEYVREHPLPGPVVPTSQDLGHEFDAVAVPYAYLVDADGVIRDKGLLRNRQRVAEMAALASVRLAQPVELGAPPTDHHHTSAQV